MERHKKLYSGTTVHKQEVDYVREPFDIDPNRNGGTRGSGYYSLPRDDAEHYLIAQEEVEYAKQRQQEQRGT